MKHLIAKEGFKYTQVDDVEIQNRVIASEIYLAVNDSEENWKLIPDAEVQQIRDKQLEYQKSIDPEYEEKQRLRLEAETRYRKEEAIAKKEMELKRLKEGK